MQHRVRAIIIEDNKILVIRRTKKDSMYFVFPGGGVGQGENLEEAIRRECEEELGVVIAVEEKFSSESFIINEIAQMNHFFICHIISGELGSGTGPEFTINSGYEGTYKIEWLELKNLSNFDLRPNIMRDKIIKR